MERISWEKLSWPQVEALDRDQTTIIIPTGAIEQHGPHLTLDTDIYNADVIARAVAKKVGSGNRQRVLVAPPVWWGTSPHHLGFPGTISLKNHTFSEILMDTISSMKPHGFYRFLLVNGHGGNIGNLTASVSQIGADLGISIPALSYWQTINDLLIEVGESEIGGMGHACEMETSLALYLRPEDVDMTQAIIDMPNQPTPWSCIDFRQPGFLNIPLDLKRDSKVGIIGNPLLATREKGERIFNAAVERISSAIEAMADLTKRDLTTSRF
jgi:creatinine amidohydrolase